MALLLLIHQCIVHQNILLKLTSMKIFFNSLGHIFLAGGDYNAKHKQWGSNIVNPIERQLFGVVNSIKLNVISTVTSIYWPSAPNKIL